MTEKDKIRAEIERLINDKTDGKHVAEADITAPKRSAYLDILNFINSIPAEQPSEVLEKFIQDLIEKYPINKESVPNDSLNYYYQGLRFGALQVALWQKEQMMKDAINGIMDCDDYNEWIEITDKLIVTPSRAGKRVKIIIIMEDEK